MIFQPKFRNSDMFQVFIPIVMGSNACWDEVKSMKKLIFTSLTASFLAACTPGEETNYPVSITISHVPSAVLSAFFVADWAPLEVAANALRTVNPLYTVQQFSWWNGSPPIHDSYSLAHGRVEYAHAAGLTGAGQTISIVDAGFLTSHDEFFGKTLTLPTGGGALGVDDHGTAVASVAAGIATAGSMIGVAPGADLQLGSFNTNASRENANLQAIATGAIVQNNSWGFEIDATDANFQGIFSGTAGTNYFNSIKNLAQNAVIVFAVSNDNSRTNADIMAALPVLDPTLQNNWVAVINAVPVFSGATITSGTVISANCLEAAAWCMAADGSVYAATATGNFDYSDTYGSSFAAPQVSGAIALLAEAFPTLSAEELRARLLASADNSFYTHSGYVEFAPGLQHGFSPEFGHGFLNMKAALSPIGGSYLPRSGGGSVAADSPTTISTGMVGDAISLRLAQYDLVIVDGMGSGFDLPANVLAAQGIIKTDPLAAIDGLLVADLSSSKVDPFAQNSELTSYASGKQFAFDADDTRISLLVPSGDSDNYGLSVSREIGTGRSQLRLGLNALHEGDGFVGVQSLLPTETINGSHAGATWDWAIPVKSNQQIGLSGSFGLAMPEGNLTDVDMTAVSYNSVNLSYSMQGIWDRGDRVVLGVGLPQAIMSGQARFTLPVSRNSGGTVFNTVNVPLTPEGRQMDLSIAYGLPLSRQSDLVLRAVRSLNSGNVSGQNMTETTIGLRFEF